MISGKRLIYLIFMVLSIACQKVPAGSDCPCGTETGTTSVCFSIQTAEIKSGSRSSMAINDKTIKSLNIFVYRDGILAAEVYSDNTSPASIDGAVKLQIQDTGHRRPGVKGAPHVRQE